MDICGCMLIHVLGSLFSSDRESRGLPSHRGSIHVKVGDVQIGSNRFSFLTLVGFLFPGVTNLKSLLARSLASSMSSCGVGYDTFTAVFLLCYFSSSAMASEPAAETELAVKDEPTQMERDEETQQIAKELEIAMDQDECSKCRTMKSSDELASSKNGYSKVVCKACHALGVMLFRQAGSEVIDALDPAAREGFFRRCNALKTSDPDGCFRYKVVRGELLESLVQTKEHVTRVGAGGSYQPLSYYANLGYDTERIKNNALHEWSEVLGDTYLVPVKHVDSSAVRRSAEETLVRSEMNAKRKHMPQIPQPKRAKKGEASEPPVTLSPAKMALRDRLHGLIDLMSDSEDEKPRTRRASASAKASAKAEAKKTEKVSKQKISCAHRVMLTLGPMLEKFEKAAKQCEKVMDDLDDHTTTLFTQEFDGLKEIMKEAQACLAKSNKGEMVLEEDLRFGTEKEVAAQVRVCKSALQAIQENKKALKKEAAGKGVA